MTATALEKAVSNLPALVNTPAMEIDAEDVALPKVYLGQFMSQAVKDGLVPPGSIYTALGADDPEPNVLWQPPKKGQAEDEGVTFYILGMRKGKSVSDGGELTLYDYNDPSAPPEAWVTFNYFVAIPETDTDVPFRWLMTRTASQSAKQINMILKRSVGRGPAWINAFQATTSKRENTKGEFFVPRITTVEPTVEGIEVANNLATMISGHSSEVQASGDEPAI